jgi:hypothetical protein
MLHHLTHCVLALAALATLAPAPEVAAPPASFADSARDPVLPLDSILGVGSLNGRVLLHTTAGLYLSDREGIAFDGRTVTLAGGYSRAYSPTGAGPAGDDINPMTLTAVWKDAKGTEHRVVTDCRGMGRYACLAMHMDLLRMYQGFFPPVAEGKTGALLRFALWRRVA